MAILIDELLAAARTFAESAAAIVLRHAAGAVAVEWKPDDSPVTAADRESEEHIRSQIRHSYPSHAIIGEELADSGGAGEYTWVIDPIDGTRSFISGVPLYGVLIAVVRGSADASHPIEKERVVVGVIALPGLGEVVAAGRGLGCTVNGKPARVSESTSIDEARILCSDFIDLARREPKLNTGLGEHRCLGRTWGDSFGYRAVAGGVAEAMIDPIVSVWDVAPMPVIIEEAGGVFSSLDGEPIVTDSALAATPRVHDAILQMRVG